MTWQSKVGIGISVLALAGLSVILTHNFTDNQPPVAQSTSSGSMAATVKGRVFLITQGGDLKPARLADVYLLSAGALPDEKSATNEAKSAKSACEHAHSDWQLESTTGLPASTISIIFEGDFLDYKNELSKLQKMFSRKSAFAAQADEDGRFLFDRVPFGSYVVVAFGQGGVNLGYWAQALQITASSPPEVKLSEPMLTCSSLF